MISLSIRQPKVVTVTHRQKRIDVAGQTILGEQRIQTHDIWMAGFYSEPVFDIDLPVGEHLLEFIFECTANRRDQNARTIWIGNEPQVPGEEIARWTMRRTVPVSVVPGESVRMILQPDVAQAIRDSVVQVEFILTTIQQPGGGGTFGGRNGMIIVDSPPMDLSFDVFARVGDEEKLIGSISARAGDIGPQNAQRIDHHPRDLFPDALTCDLVLRASPTAAERTIDIFEVWDGEIIIEDVPIRAAESIEQR